MPVTLYWGYDLTDDDLRDFGIEERCIRSCLQTWQIDFLLMCDPDLVEEGVTSRISGPLWAFVRNLNQAIVSNSIEHKHINFRGERKFVLLCWH